MPKAGLSNQFVMEKLRCKEVEVDGGAIRVASGYITQFEE